MTRCAAALAIGALCAYVCTLPHTGPASTSVHYEMAKKKPTLDGENRTR